MKLNAFPEYSHLDGDVILHNHTDVIPVDCIDDTVKDSMLSILYAPDPETGFPNNDLVLSLAHDQRPEVQNYINSMLRSSLPSTARGDNPDDVIDFTKSRNETFEAYSDRIKKFVESLNNKKS